MEIFILIGIVLAGLVVLLWFRSNKNTNVKVESVTTQAVVAPIEVKEEPIQEKVEEVTKVEEVPVIVDEVVPEVVKPVRKPKAKKPAQSNTPKPKRTRKPKA